MFFVPSAFAQDDPIPENETKIVYAITFADDSAYHFRFYTLFGVSLQNYITGPYKVTEVVLEISGSSSQVRIYSTELLDPMDAQGIAQNVLPENLKKYANAPTQVANITAKGKEQVANTETIPVIKEYPITTHSKTIEFKVSSKEIKKFHRAILREFLDFKGELGSNSFKFTDTNI